MKKLLFSDPPYGSIHKILLIMKLTIILTLVFTLNLSAVGYGQISLNEKGKSVKEVLSKLEKETSYRFFYNDDLKAIDNLVDIEIESSNINQVLNKLFASTDFDYKLFDNNLIVITPKSEDYQLSVSGKVTDASTGEALPGVSILVKGTTTGLSTDINGAYTINIPNPNATLVFSFIGYIPQEVLVSGRSKVDVSLKVDVTTLEEVVVVGYGTQKKSDITGTVSSLPKERLQMSPNLNIAQAIQGSMAGVMVHTATSGAAPSQSILVRGKNSITANNDPLIVVDGIPYGGSLTDINPYDVESIEVLKDASAAAIYGSRGANGVILVTTKQGTSGKPVVSYEGKYSVLDVAKINRMLTGPEFYEFKKTRVPTSITQSEEKVFQDGTWTDWTKLALRTGQSQEHNLSISGGFNDTKYYVGGGLIDIKSVARNDNFRRFSSRINVETKILPWLTVGTRTQLSFDDGSGIEANFHVALETNPLGKAYDEYGNLTIWPWPENIIVGNPLGPMLYDNTDKSHQILTNNFLVAEIPYIKGLTYRLNTGITTKSSNVYTYRGRDTQSGYEDQGEASVSNSNSNNTVIENILSYNRTFGNHTIFATALYSYEGSKYNSNGIGATQFPNDFLSWYGVGQAKVVVPKAGFTETNLISQMLRMNYSYSSKYLLTLTVRRDGFSGFGANNKWGVFPSLALGWNIAKESFFPAKEIITDMKLRASYGLNGNQAIGAYQSLPKMVVSNYMSGSTAQIGYKPGTMGVSNLGWESSRTLNLGVDFGILKSRISGNIDWYLTNTYDLLLARSISVIHGITEATHLPHWEHPQVTENIGETQNSGFEVVLNSRNIVNGKLQWSTSGNISFNNNKIVSLYGKLDENGKELDDVSNKWFIGKPIDVNYDFVWGGVWQTAEATEAAAFGTQPGYAKILDTNGDGQLTADDRRIVGQLDPKIIWGLTNTFTYSNFTLSVFVHGQAGATVQNYLMNDEVQGSEVRYNTLYKNWWTPDNPSNEWVMNKENAHKQNGFSASIYEKTDFARIKDVSLGYDLPKALIGKAGFTRVRLYVTGRNLATFTKWRGMDPDLTDEEGQQRIPMQKEYVFGLSVGF
jgi:TonB-linked SusC/RagA family outer membrane protein